MELGRKDNFVTANRPTVTEDEYGDLTTTSNEQVAQFWASVKEIEPLEKDLTFDYGKPRLTRTIKMMVDSRDTTNLEIDDQLTIDSSTDLWRVSEIFESGWKYSNTIIAQIKN